MPPLKWLDRKRNGPVSAEFSSPAARRMPHAPKGFTLVELLTVTAVIGVVSAIALPTFNRYYESCCIRAAAAEITGMIKEAKQNALCADKYYGIGFDPVSGKVSLISGKGPDDRWNTADDQTVRSFRLTDKGGGLCFGYGAYGPAPSCGNAPDGISFQYNNTLECNPNLTGNGGAVYLISRSGRAMAIVMNNTDFGYKLYDWEGRKWVRR